jgi:hypothetical protein
MRKLILACLVGGAMLGGTVALGKGTDVSAKKHPNLAAAQKLIDQAFDKVTAAQKANEFDMAGHAARAKELLEQARGEIKLAAEVANEANAPKK